MKKSGFTLVELLVSLTLLSVVFLITMGMVVSTNLQVRQTRQERRVMDNLNFAVEHMVRSITYGKDYLCGAGSPCPIQLGGSPSIQFTGYYLDLANSTIAFTRNVSSTGQGYIERAVNGQIASLTDPAIDIQELTFYIYNLTPPMQPRVVIVVKGISNATATPRPFLIQTTVSQRALNL